MIGQRDNVIIKIVVILYEFMDRRVSVADIGVAVRLEFIVAPGIPIDAFIRVGNDPIDLRLGITVDAGTAREKDNSR